MGERVDAARAGEGPSLVVATCYRFEGHFAGDTQTYRDEGGGRASGSRETLSPRFRARLVADGVVSEQEARSWRPPRDDEVAAALAVAKESPLPAPETAWEDVHALTARGSSRTRRR